MNEGERERGKCVRARARGRIKTRVRVGASAGKLMTERMKEIERVGGENKAREIEGGRKRVRTVWIAHHYRALPYVR